MSKEVRIGLYEKSMPNSLTIRQKLEYTADCGYDFLELSIDETDAKLSRLEWTAEERFALVRDMHETGVRIDTICLSGQRKYPMGSEDPDTRARSMDIIKKAIRFAADIGVRLIQLAGYDVYYVKGNAHTEQLFAEGLREAVEYAAAYKVCLGFETMETSFMDTCAKAMKYVADVNSSYLGVYPDIGNLTNASLIYGTPVLDDLKTAEGHIMAMHLKETVPGKYREIPFGTGHVDFPAAIREAERQGVRSFTLEFWSAGDDVWERDVRENRKFIAERFNEGEQNA